jgi:hypothetical protein
MEPILKAYIYEAIEGEKARIRARNLLTRSAAGHRSIGFQPVECHPGHSTHPRCGRTPPKALHDVLAISAHRPVHPDSKSVRLRLPQMSRDFSTTFPQIRKEVLAVTLTVLQTRSLFDGGIL